MTDTSRMLFLTNIPGGADAPLTDRERYWRLHGVEGQPRATHAHSVAELVRMGYIGLYDPKRQPESVEPLDDDSNFGDSLRSAPESDTP